MHKKRSIWYIICHAQFQIYFWVHVINNELVHLFVCIYGVIQDVVSKYLCILVQRMTDNLIDELSFQYLCISNWSLLPNIFCETWSTCVLLLIHLENNDFNVFYVISIFSGPSSAIFCLICFWYFGIYFHILGLFEILH